jgi:hypothetical protein
VGRKPDAPERSPFILPQYAPLPVHWHLGWLRVADISNAISKSTILACILFEAVRDGLMITVGRHLRDDGFQRQIVN